MNDVILIIEDSKTIRMYQESTLEKLGLRTISAGNLDEVKLLLKEYGKNIALAIVDINLPDCEDCVLDHLLKLNIPSIAMTGSFHPELHSKIISKNVIDYIVLEDDVNLDILSTMVQRILNNHHTKILIVDDSKTSRMRLKTFLIHQNFTILEASSGAEAIKLIKKHSDIKIALVDYEMPEMNGAKLTRIIRKRHSRMEMAILAISIHNEPLITVEFLKSGANDFITKPFIKEEVSARIAVNLDMVDMHTKANKEIQEKKRAELKLEKLNATLEEKVKEEIEKNRLKEEYLQSQSRMAQMGEMISMIAHQWRQPLGAISSTVIDLNMQSELENFNLEHKQEAEEYEAYVNNGLKDISQFVRGLTITIDDFRNFYKPNKKLASVKLEDVIYKSLNIIKASLKNNNIEIIKEYNSKEEIKLHDTELMQVILNILKNAQDNFKEKQTTDSYIKIKIENRTISICDNGGGIPKDIIEKIFDPYFSTKNEKSGTGLGLHMSKTIVEEHHKGKLSVHNTADGVCFKIELGIIS